MIKRILSLCLTFLILCLVSTTPALAQNNKTMAETVVHLLSYVGMDYSGAVQNGKIISQQEYKEQKEFSQQAYDLTQKSSFLSGSPKTEVLSDIDQIIKVINSKGASEKINQLTTKVNDRIIKITDLQTAPKVWPSLANGKKIFIKYCASCHGEKGYGDGPGGQMLDPKPSNFHDADLMANFSPYQAYNSIRLGVPGTAMQSYSTQINDVQLWDLAFYVKSLRFRNIINDSLLLRQSFKQIFSTLGLSKISKLTDKELLDTIRKYKPERAKTKLIALRTLMPKGKNAGNSLPTARKGLKASLKSYQAGHKKMARTQAISAYLEGIEPVEARLRSINSDFVIQLETQMFDVRQAIGKDQGNVAVQNQVKKAMILIDKANDMMQGQQLNFWLTFILSATIMLREGIEAFLVLLVLISLIRSTGVRKALPWLHGGWITALVCGIAGWFLSDYIIQFGGKNREIMEGLISLFAVLVLIYVGFWMHNHTSAQKWQSFIKDKVDRYLKKDRMFGLAAFSFIVVFRELFEVILFLQAINLEAANTNKSAIGLGVVAALIAIAIIAYLLLKGTKNIPIRQLFQYSTWFFVLLAVVLIGKGFHALQESGWITITSLKDMFRAEWLGIYPTVQTLLAQSGLIVLVVAIFYLSRQREKRLQLKKG